MVTVLVIGDPHFKVSNTIDTDAMCESILDISKRILPDFIVVLGDVLDRHESIHVSPLTRAIAFLESLMKVSRTFVLIGNHDLKNNRQYLSEEHPFTSLKNWGKDMIIVDTPLVSHIKGKKFVFVPYVPPGRFLEALGNVEWEDATTIFAHQEFYGVKMGLFSSIEGDKWDLRNPLVISGHIHDHDRPQENILYTGTPIQHSFGDQAKKTISLMTFGDTIHEERISLRVRRKKTVSITCDQVSDYVPNTSCDLKIVINGLAAEIKTINKHPNTLRWKKEGHKLCFKTVTDSCLAIGELENRERYSELLVKNIQWDTKLVSLYDEVFRVSSRLLPKEKTKPRLILKL